MKKSIILFFAFTLSVQFANAQTDATKKETVQWLNFYGIKGNLIKKEYKRGWSELMYEWNVYLNSKGNAIFECNEKYRGNENLNWRDKDLKSPLKILSIMDVSFIGIRPPTTAKSYCVYITTNKNITTNRRTYVKFCLEKESANSLFKALKHLASFYDTNIEFSDMVSLKNKF